MRWVTLREAAELTGRNAVYLWECCKRGRVQCQPPEPGHRVGWLIPESELERLRARRKPQKPARSTPPRFLPTPAEIEAACAEIRAGWTDEDYRLRERHPTSQQK